MLSDKRIEKTERKIAYFSMEIGLDARIPTYSGGLGILAGDTLKSCADLNVPIVGVTIISRKGYFYQRIDPEGMQHEEEVTWVMDDFLTLLPNTASVKIRGRDVKIQAWEYVIKGVNGFEVPVIFLDTCVEGNTDEDKRITDKLYGPGEDYRLVQEIVLGIGGYRMLKELGFSSLQTFHMNEGHSALLTLELLKETEKKEEKDIARRYDMDSVRKRCVFTTHTPVPAGHDKFEFEMVKSMLGDYISHELIESCCHDSRLNMTYLALNLSHYINGVAKKHGEISRDMFPGYPIDSITNGVHAVTWTGPAFQRLYDQHIGGWRADTFSLRYALGINKDEIWQAHMEEKRRLLDYVNAKQNCGFDKDVLTIGFARRSTSYKRATLLFHDIERLKNAAGVNRLQIIFAGKAHVRDGQGKDIIKEIIHRGRELRGRINIVYLENYDMEVAKLLVAGVDVWLNTPLRPREASGTSGMKACMNGVVNFSVLDGWWIEGHVEDVTGWSIGPLKSGEENDDLEDSLDLYRKLEEKIIPLFYTDKAHWIKMMKYSIALNAAFFNTHRMVQQYVTNAYLG